MRIAFFSDIHSNVHALEAALDHVKQHNVSRMVCLGDIVGYNANPVESLRRVRETMDDVILGNHDWAVVLGAPIGFNPVAKEGVAFSKRVLPEEEAAYLRDVQPQARDRVEDVELEFFHASHRDPLWEYVFPQNAPDAYEDLVASRPDDARRVIVLGHTHVPMVLASHTLPVDQLGDHAPDLVRHELTPDREHPLVLLNPGSVGQPRDGDARASYAILDTRTLSVTFHRVPYDIDAAARAVRDAGLPDVLADRLYLGR